MADSTTPFQPGDVVQLKSGGPLMTVYSTYDDYVNCYYSTLESPARELNGLIAIALQKAIPPTKPTGTTFA